MKPRFVLFCFSLAFVTVLFLPAFGQIVPVSGKVTLKKPGGSMLPAAGVQVDIYRTDMKWEAHATTNANGEYSFPGVPFVGTYAITASAAGAKPEFISGIRGSQLGTRDFQLQPGDGSRLTLDQIKAAASPSVQPPAGTMPVESAEARAVRERLERETRAIEESNRKITEANDIVNRTFKAGNDAYAAKNYDAAIKAYDEGLAAREEPALYSNKSIALRARGVELYNSAVNSKDDAARKSGIDAAKKDWIAAAEAGRRAFDIMKTIAVPADPQERSSYEDNRLSSLTAYAEAMRLVATKVDQEQAETAFRIYSEYAATEIDPTKRSQRRLDAAKILYDAGKFDRANAEFRKIISAEPRNPYALLYLGLCLFSNGEKTKFQEAADHLAVFAAEAPESDPMKLDARSILDFLKTQENITPRKLATTRPKL